MEGGFRLGLLVSIVVLDGYGIHSRRRMRVGSTEIGTRRPIDCVYGISSSTAGQHGGTGWIRHSHSQSHKNARAFNRERYTASIVFMEYDLALLVSMAVLDGYGIHSRSRMNARWYNRDGYLASIVFMEFHLGLMVSIAVLDMAGIHIRTKNARALVQ